MTDAVQEVLMGVLTQPANSVATQAESRRYSNWAEELTGRYSSWVSAFRRSPDVPTPCTTRPYAPCAAPINPSSQLPDVRPLNPPHVGNLRGVRALHAGYFPASPTARSTAVRGLSSTRTFTPPTNPATGAMLAWARTMTPFPRRHSMQAAGRLIREQPGSCLG